MVCGPAPLPQTSFSTLYPPFDQVAHLLLDEKAAPIAMFVSPRTKTGMNHRNENEFRMTKPSKKCKAQRPQLTYDNALTSNPGKVEQQKHL